MRGLIVSSILALTVAAGLPRDASAADRVELRAVNYKDLGAAIRQLKGKVIVVDFWADT
jgi:hypothetical protein